MKRQFLETLFYHDRQKIWHLQNLGRGDKGSDQILGRWPLLSRLRSSAGANLR